MEKELFNDSLKALEADLALGTKQKLSSLDKMTRLVGLLISIVMIALSVLVIYTAFAVGFIPTKYIAIFAVIIIAINLLVAYLLFSRGGLVKRISGLVLVLLSGLVFILGVDVLSSVDSAIDRIATPVDETRVYSIIVREDDSIKSLNDLNNTPIGYVDDSSVAYVNSLDSYDLNLGEEYIAYPNLASSLLSGEERVIAFDESFRTMVQDLHPDFLVSTRIVQTNASQEYLSLLNEDRAKLLERLSGGAGNSDDPYGDDSDEGTYETINPEDAYEPVQSEMRTYEDIYVNGLEPFTFLISGNDESGYGVDGGISNTGLSDVNIVGAVNPKTRQVILIHIPRDSYVPIYGTGGYYDKLTHSGYYGISGTLGSVENLMRRDISAYVKVNFNTLIYLVDALGGITVNNPYEFYSGGYSYPEGNIRMNGAMALQFSRERYSLPGGDFDRGKNQIRVIQGIVNEAIKLSNLLNYNTILDQLSGLFQTNLPEEAVNNLVKNQLANGGGWNIDSYTIDGYSQMGLHSYLMPGYNLYFFLPYQESLEEARKAIAKVVGY